MTAPSSRTITRSDLLARLGLNHCTHPHTHPLVDPTNPATDTTGRTWLPVTADQCTRCGTTTPRP